MVCFTSRWSWSVFWTLTGSLLRVYSGTLPLLSGEKPNGHFGARLNIMALAALRGPAGPVPPISYSISIWGVGVTDRHIYPVTIVYIV